MMINTIYMLYDDVSGSFIGSPMIMVNDNIAKRSMASFVNSPNFPYKSFINDIKLYKLGSFNFETGEIIPGFDKIDDKGNVIGFVPGKKFLCNLNSLEVKDDTK